MPRFAFLIGMEDCSYLAIYLTWEAFISIQPSDSLWLFGICPIEDANLSILTYLTHLT